jgi:hypothetical protein
VGLSPLKVGGPHLNGFLDQIDSSKVMTANGGEGSALTFGGYDVEKFAKKGSKLRWIPIDAENSNFWSLAMASEIKMGD